MLQIETFSCIYCAFVLDNAIQESPAFVGINKHASLYNMNLYNVTLVSKASAIRSGLIKQLEPIFSPKPNFHICFLHGV